jgi:hypothetical protein
MSAHLERSIVAMLEKLKLSHATKLIITKDVIDHCGSRELALEAVKNVLETRGVILDERTLR